MTEFIEHPFISDLRSKYHLPKNEIEKGIEYDCRDGDIISLKIWGLHFDINDFKELKILNELRYLDLSGTHIKQIDGFEHFPKLEGLSLGDDHLGIGNEISEITGLESLGKLRLLNLSFNKIKELKNLENLTLLDQLFITNNYISKIDGLENLTNLEDNKKVGVDEKFGVN